MRTALGADGFATERTVIYPGNYLVVTVAVIERAHDFKMRLLAVGAWQFINNKVAGVALVFAFLFRNIVKSLVFFS